MFTLALSALVTMGVQAQKQMGGEHNVEVSFTPFSGSPIDGSTIKYRNFMDDDKAFRLSLTMSNSSDVHAYMQDGELLAANPVSPQLNISSKSSTFGIAPGYEMHFDGMDNLSPYFAFELPITLCKPGRLARILVCWGSKSLDWRRNWRPTIRPMGTLGLNQFPKFYSGRFETFVWCGLLLL